MDDASAANRQVLELTARMGAQEHRLLSDAQALDVRRQHHTTLAIALAFAAFAMMLVPAYGGVLLESRRRRRTERQMTELVENLPLTVWQMLSRPDGTQRFVYVGPNAQAERGVSNEELLRRSDLAWRSVLPEDRPRLRAAMEAAERDLSPVDCDIRIVDQRAAGVRWIRKRALLSRLPDGSILWTGYWADITKQKDIEQALREATDSANGASRAKSSFLATMSHEIRTPMNGVLGLLELLSLTRLDADQRATLGVVRESGRSLMRIIDDILDFSKVEAGQLALHPVPASLAATVTRARQVHSGIASSRGLLLQETVAAGIAPALLFDPLRVGQILDNFISNAVKFTEEGSVTIRAELVEATQDAQRVRITVSDTGIGVAPETLQQLFAPFAQAASDTAARFGGTGLGLAICRRLATLMGGSVAMHSEPGAGTRTVFEATFPLADPAQVAQPAAEAAHRRLTNAISHRRAVPDLEEAEREGTLVLVADDHPTNRLLLARQVAALGYAVLAAEDGQHAFELWQSHRFGLVLTDVHMPRLNGYELARAIRHAEGESGKPRIPILGCTANAMNNESARCLAAGMDDCLVKPVDLLELVERLDHWIPLAAADAPEFVDLPAASPPASRSEVFDPWLLTLVCNGDRALERNLLTEFRRTNDEDLAQLQQAADTGAMEDMKRLTHRMKGAAQTLGASALLAACRLLEEHASTEASRLREPLARLRAEVERLYAALTAHLDRAAA